MTRRYVLSFLIIAFIFLIAYGWGFTRFITSPASEHRQVVIFEVAPGANLSKVAYKLKEENLITSFMKFKLAAKIARASTKIKEGEYELHTRMTPLTILQILSQGKSIEYPITFQEGLNMYEMAQIFEDKGFGKKEDFLSLCRDRTFIRELLESDLGSDLDSLEGYLFPDTYQFRRNVAPKLFIETIVKRFKSVYKEVSQSSNTMKMPIHNHVTLASIIEKETGEPDERKLISSVFHNRLKQKMRLQSDPTILYGILDKTKVMPQNITKEDIRQYTKYNTYTVPALPHGPIANPGREALKATLNPGTSNYLFFVSNNNGSHVFSKNLKQHNTAVKKWQLNPENRKGRSWRNLKKASGQ